jgi:hypothetical protein
MAENDVNQIRLKEEADK